MAADVFSFDDIQRGLLQWRNRFEFFLLSCQLPVGGELLGRSHRLFVPCPSENHSERENEQAHARDGPWR